MGYYSAFATFTQATLYGRKHFRQPAYQKLRKTWLKDQTDLTENADLYDMTAKVCMVSGSNSGIGREIAEYLAKRGACVYMVCRNPVRGAAAQKSIIAASGNENVHLLLCDMSLQSQVRQMWSQFLDHRADMVPSSVKGAGGDRTTVLDVLVCNAGALLNEKTITEEGVETTFGAHLVFGTHLLGRLAMPSLEETKNSRCVITTSGGMYGSKFPTWDRVLAREPKDKYNGVLAYSYAKRGQVLLAEEWGKKYTKTRIVTAHPGWAKTPGTAAAFGDQEKYLNPMRTPWEGADGICYLCCCDQSNLESGAFYLDRTPQVKHIAGPFFTEGSYTKNTKDEVAFMMKKLDAWNFGSGIERLASEEELVTAQAMKSKPLQEMDGTVDTPAFMGKWYVLAGIPTIFEKGGVNPTEVYTWNDKKNNIDVNFYLNKDAHTDKVTVFEQRATVNDIAVGTRWALCPKIGPVYAPINLAYLILHNENKATIIGVPNRDYVWIMARDPKMEEDQLDELIDKCGHLGYDRAKIMRYEHTRDITDDSNAEVFTEL